MRSESNAFVWEDAAYIARATYFYSQVHVQDTWLDIEVCLSARR